LEDARLREKAVKDALLAQEKRKKEKEEKDAKDRKDREDRENAVQARNKAFRDAEKLQKQAERLTEEISQPKMKLRKSKKTRNAMPMKLLS